MGARQSPALLGWAALIGPIAGLGGVGFLRLAAVARRYAASGWRIPIATTVVVAALGGLLTPSLATGVAVTARALLGHTCTPGGAPAGEGAP